MLGRLNAYQKSAVITVFATLFLILVGGLVRAAGAGLGCPDWPHCFGSWIPPLSVDDLPPEFDASQFNVVKTWIEYVNRLVGVAIGLLITLTFWRSFKYRRSNPAIFLSSAAAFVLVIFQGWLGGQVVASELETWLITAHMLLAMLIVNLLVYAVYRAMSDDFRQKLQEATPQRLLLLFGGLLGSALVQMVLGTQVREQIDHITNTTPDLPREFWVPSLDVVFEIHRSFSWLILLVSLYLGWYVKQHVSSSLLRRCGFGILAIVLAQVVSGIGMQMFNIPPAFQVVHLVLSALMVCLAFFGLLVVRRSSDVVFEGASLAPASGGS